MNKKLNYNVPDGYFEDLKTRLSSIPAQESRPSRFARLTPYLAFAACFAALVIAGNAILKKTASPAASDEEIIEYLIASDITLAQIEDYLLSN